MAPAGSHANTRAAHPCKRAAPTVKKAAAKPVKKPVENPTAIVYVSQWCGDSGKTFRNNCQRAMDTLRDAGVPFVERDIFDDRYRDEYVQKMQSIGRRPPAVPLIDIDGHLALGANGSVWSIVRDARKGLEPRVDYDAGITKPPSPKERVYEPGETWVEPPDSPAIVYGSKHCPHCRPTKKFLKKHGVKSIQRDQFKPKYRAEMEAHMNRFGRTGPSAPTIYIFGRFLIGLDYDSIEALVQWRRSERERAAKEAK